MMNEEDALDRHIHLHIHELMPRRGFRFRARIRTPKLLRFLYGTFLIGGIVGVLWLNLFR